MPSFALRLTSYNSASQTRPLPRLNAKHILVWLELWEESDGRLCQPLGTYSVLECHFSASRVPHAGLQSRTILRLTHTRYMSTILWVVRCIGDSVFKIHVWGNWVELSLSWIDIWYLSCCDVAYYLFVCNTLILQMPHTIHTSLYYITIL